MQLEVALACEVTSNISQLWLWQCLAAGRHFINYYLFILFIIVSWLEVVCV